MAKKLKKKIEDLCGLTGLEYEARRSRAIDILASREWKQQLCNDLAGLSFKDIERTLNGIIDERELRAENEDDKLQVYNSNRKLKQKQSAVSDLRQSTKARITTGRTLKDILDQVYAPRVTTVQFSKEERAKLDLLLGVSRRDEVFSDATDEDSEAE